MPTIQYSFSKNDEYFTPAYAVYPIVKYLKPNSLVWCPFDTEESEFVRVLSESGFSVTYSHIATGQDFFTVTVPECQYIISNPPYSKRSKVIKRLYEIGKPFAMLVNMQGVFDSRERFEMFKKNRVEIIFLNPRVNYLSGNRELVNSVPFQSGYLCSGICQNQIEFEYVYKS